MSTPIIPWMGGKRRLADRLIPLFPPHECYVEVFAGGAALYFMKPQPSPVEVLNDINGDLVTLYRVVQNHLEEFVRPAKPTTFLSCDDYLIFLSTGREHGKYCLNELLAENGTPRKQD